MRKAQTATEFLALIGFGFIVILVAFFYFVDLDSSASVEIEDSLDNLATTATNVHTVGSGNKQSLKVSVSTQIEAVEISGSNLIFTSGSETYIQEFPDTIVGYNFTQNGSINYGDYDVVIEPFDDAICFYTAGERTKYCGCYFDPLYSPYFVNLSTYDNATVLCETSEGIKDCEDISFNETITSLRSNCNDPRHDVNATWVEYRIYNSTDLIQVMGNVSVADASGFFNLSSISFNVNQSQLFVNASCFSTCDVARSVIESDTMGQDIPTITTCVNQGDGFAGGDGTVGDPWHICNCSMLQDIDNNLSASYQLSSDVDCSISTSWNSGAGFDPITNPFEGNLYGGNYTISNFFINRPSEDLVGLFKYTYGDNISSLTFENASVTGRSSVGILAGQFYATTWNHSIQGSVIGTDSVGGLFGYYGTTLTDTIENSTTNVSVYGGSDVGGLVGSMYAGIVENSYSHGLVNGSTIVGGLIGEMDYVNINNSGSTADVNGTTIVGGFIGETSSGYSSDVIDNSYATGNVIGTSDVGGFIGFNRKNVTNSYATGNVTGNADVGGLIGEQRTQSIHYSNATGRIFGGSQSGGLVGHLYTATIDNSFARGDVNGSATVGGLVGAQTVSYVYYSNATGDVNATAVGSYAGGLTGQVYQGEIDFSFATGNVNGSGYVGGLAGYAHLATKIDNSYATGNVSGTSRVGGLFGYANSITANYNYNTGYIFCTTQYCGGVVGDTGGSFGTTDYLEWTNHTGDNVTGCQGQSGSTGGLDLTNCVIS